MPNANPKEDLLEDDDFVIGATIYNPDIIRHFVVDDSFGDKMLYDENGDFYIQNDQMIIKTIRKPRKGGKEARAIVAMLARNYHECRIREWKIERKTRNGKPFHWSENTMVCLDNFQMAKAMLI